MKFGQLTIVDKDYGVSKLRKGTYFKCECDCGNKVSVFSGNLKNNQTTSCGCLQKEVVGNRYKTHGKSNDKLYKILTGMKRRCYSPNYSKYNDYGGRGITICDEWLNDFMKFYNWANVNGYQEGLTIERIDVNGNYSDDNCTWITMSEQAKNKRESINIEINGEKFLLIDMLRSIGREDEYGKIKYSILNDKLDIETALKLPNGKLNRNLFLFKQLLIDELDSVNVGYKISKIDIMHLSGDISRTTLRKYLNKQDVVDLLKELKIEIHRGYLVKGE